MRSLVFSFFLFSFSANFAEASTLRLLLESDTNASAGSELFVVSYDTFDDLVNSPSGVPGVFSGLGISPGFSVRGFAYDGKYRLLLESDTNASGGSELFIVSYDTFDDLVNSPSGVPGVFSGLGISSGFSVGGLAYDGKYRLLLESDTDASAGSEIFLASFDTFDDLMNSPSGVPGVFSGLGISPGFSVRGFAYEYDSVDPPTVPLPPSVAFMLGALGLLAGLRRRA